MSTPNPSPTVAVTGAAGYIGSRVVSQIQREHPDWEIIAVDNFYLGTIREIGDVTVQHVDIRNRERLEAVLDGADIVLHLAAISGVDDCDEKPDLAFEVNVQGTENVAWFCRKSGAGLAFPFSMAVLGDPAEFPITVDLPRDPMNWYGRTKLLGEQSIRTYADGSFPAHLFLISNLYGEHRIAGQRVSKGTVINFFVDRVFSDQPLTVYEPGTQSRNYIHVTDVANAYLRSAEELLAQLDRDETGARAYEIASDEDPSVQTVAELVRRIASEEADIDTEVSLVENPRSGETLVDQFAVDTSRTRSELGWEPEHTVEETVRELVRERSGE
ncbi:NAD-dependent epimerase/dehydratase family protein [Halovenus sp. WSH3]|uniref:NAD-dependent epimerase/dehydratase family protein n=1 Tax=Halovenus carboxidivorans TaxID=2692199 RepID=A0A6B0T1A5_9EURY|nr:NAD-dependent epimerase/dehydratase family protein [Halovenus carboxidivorans]MXR51715.1 NAD-dependent epimerase/dehydratase family protein [Halovenus carboxidivorans]